MKIDILGTEYDYELTTEHEDTRLCGCDGYCDAYEKRIAIENGHNKNAPGSIANFDSLYQKVKRHEIIHAYLFESGLQDYAGNEQLVDWIAWRFPKLLKTFEEVGAIQGGDVCKQ